MNMRIALSTSVFEGDRLPLLNGAAVPSVEVSSHKPDALDALIHQIQEQGIDVVGVHGPAPNSTGNHPNLGADRRYFEEDYDLIAATFRTAQLLGTKSVTIHPFYDLAGRLALPKEDEEEFRLLRPFLNQPVLAVHRQAAKMSQTWLNRKGINTLRVKIL